MTKHFFILVFAVSSLFAVQRGNPKQIVDLRGTWKFEIGDNRKYAEPGFDDAKWSDVFVPADWENEGFAGYDGYAWYRRTFPMPAASSGKKFILNLGNVDDVCAVYVNGVQIGESGMFPPHFTTAYDRELKFVIPKRFLKFNQQNLIAVRVYDDRLNGGIVKGKIGISAEEDEMEFVAAFPDLWKFRSGDEPDWKKPSFDDSKWSDLIVPAPWDFQGFRDYDGFGWYRVSFDLPATAPADDLVLLLGLIDDIDETYLNGEKIGSTGRIRSDGSVSRVREEYRELRAYEIPASALKRGGKNVLAVRVYDNMLIGGIYEGPVGIVTQKEYRRWYRWSERNDSRFDTPIDQFFEKLFSK